MTERLAIVGAGGMARCVLDLIDAINLDQSGTGSRYEVVGVIADPAPDMTLLKPRGIRYLGGQREGFDRLDRDTGFVIAIGNSQVRRELDSWGSALGHPSPVLVHPNAHLGYGVELGPGSLVCSHVSIESDVRLGRHVHVNQNSTIGHDSRLDDYVTVSPLVAVSGNVHAEQAVFIGTGSAIREKTTLHHDSTVGMGATVVEDVPASTTVVGTPARATDRHQPELTRAIGQGAPLQF